MTDAHDLHPVPDLTLAHYLILAAVLLVVVAGLALACSVVGPVALTLTATALVPVIAVILIGFSRP